MPTPKTYKSERGDNHYLAVYFDGQRWKLITREIDTDPVKPAQAAARYRDFGYPTEFLRIPLLKPTKPRSRSVRKEV